MSIYYECGFGKPYLGYRAFWKMIDEGRLDEWMGEERKRMVMEYRKLLAFGEDIGDGAWGVKVFDDVDLRYTMAMAKREFFGSGQLFRNISDMVGGSRVDLDRDMSAYDQYIDCTVRK